MPGRRPAPGEGQLGFDLDLPTPVARPTPEAPAPARRHYTAAGIARVLGRPEPTDEQAAVIEAPLAPLLVIAGAGSGKTETMAARVVWLVANGLVEPDQVLGLTFTRKAAGELADRVRARLRTLHRRGVIGEPHPVAVSTYHAYAASVLGDHALRIGIEPGARLLGEAGGWQLADELVQRWEGDMAGVDWARPTVVEAVLSLAGECAEHLLEPEAIEAVAERVLERIATLPKNPGDEVPGKPKADVREVARRLEARRRLLPLVRAYAERKREHEVLDFGDQVALAARLARAAPEVGAGERERYRVVLLDEYQDTSHAQVVLLQSLFGGGHPVIAVGDPHQSIYAWRGASAGTLQRFGHDFPHRDGGAAAVRHLSTSWRNDEAVLTVANRLAEPLRHPPAWADPARTVDVRALAARPGAGPGRVRVEWHATVEDEARGVADVAAHAWHSRRADGSRPSVAVLCRVRAQFPLVEAALRARGLPVEVIGLGGLLHVPEIADLRAALEVVHDPTRGDALMRLLVGPAWRIGPPDLEGLGAWARELAGRWRTATVLDADGRPQPPPAGPGAAASGPAGSGPAGSGVAGSGVAGSGSTGPADRAAGPVVEVDAVDDGSVVEALDLLPEPGWTGPQGQRISPEGRQRLDGLAGVLRGLRARAGLALPDLVLEAERALLLDVEVAARPGHAPAAARAHLDAFADVAAAFADTGDRPTLGSFLGWLSAAEARERGLDTGVVEQHEDAVQLLTVHGAKGLEWDVVAVTGLVEGTFPAGHGGRPPRRSKGWLSDIGAVPFPLRGDADGLPQWQVEAATTQDELEREFVLFTERCGAHEVDGERRLAYVAATRARHSLLLTGAVWGDGSTPREPSRFLQDVAELALEAARRADDAAGDDVPATVRIGLWTDLPGEGAQNPRVVNGRTATWPDPLAGRREAVEAGAGLVESAVAALTDRLTGRVPTDVVATAAVATDVVATDAGPADADPAAQVDLTGADPAGDVTAVDADPADRPVTGRDVDDEEAAWAREVDLLLAERDARADGEQTVRLPVHLSASRAVALAVDPDALAQALRRPMPEPPSPQARRGTEFHAWLERRFQAAALVDVDELPGSGDVEDVDETLALAELQAAFLASEWADRTAEAVEVAVETPVAGVTLRGRIDAVFTRPDGGWDVVDWKTGREPGPERARELAVQLAVYRLAWARLHGVGVERVGAAFFYASTGRTVRPVDLLDEAGLVRLLTLPEPARG